MCIHYLEKVIKETLKNTIYKNVPVDAVICKLSDEAMSASKLNESVLIAASRCGSDYSI